MKIASIHNLRCRKFALAVQNFELFAFQPKTPLCLLTYKNVFDEWGAYQSSLTMTYYWMCNRPKHAWISVWLNDALWWVILFFLTMQITERSIATCSIFSLAINMYIGRIFVNIVV